MRGVPDPLGTTGPGPDVVRLADEERDIPEDIARIVALGDLKIRRQAAPQVLRIFYTTNLAVLLLLFVLFLADVILLATGVETARDRIIDHGVIKTLIGATVVQTGAIMITMTRYLFPRAAQPGFFRRLFGRG